MPLFRYEHAESEYALGDHEYNVYVYDLADKGRCRKAVSAKDIGDELEGLEWLAYEADMLAVTYREQGSGNAKVELVRTDNKSGDTILASTIVELLPAGAIIFQRSKYTEAHAERPKLVATKKAGA